MLQPLALLLKAYNLTNSCPFPCNIGDYYRGQTNLLCIHPMLSSCNILKTKYDLLGFFVNTLYECKLLKSLAIQTNMSPTDHCKHAIHLNHLNKFT